MQSLLILFSALTVYGIGVTVVDMFGVFENAGSDQSGSAEDNSDTDDSDDGTDDSSDSDTVDLIAEAPDSQSSDQADASSHSLLSFENRKQPAISSRMAKISRGKRGTQLVTRSISALRSTVYFSLGAGPTGLFGILTGQPLLSTLGWSAGAGVLISLISKLLRKVLRKDLDSSIKAEEYLMDKAVISIPVLPGQIGKALVRRYDREVELYVKAKDPSVMLAKGTNVRIIDMDEAVYFIEED